MILLKKIIAMDEKENQEAIMVLLVSHDNMP
jgi:hypothetical protein